MQKNSNEKSKSKSKSKSPKKLEDNINSCVEWRV